MKRVAAVRELDQHMATDARHALELSNLDTRRVHELRPAMSIDAKDFYTWLAEPANRSRFWHAVPGVDVLVTLLIERDKNEDAKTHRSDTRNLSMLKVAIPYANIVVAENLWAHVANATRLATKYETTVISDLARLPDVLREHGCL